MKTAIKGNHAVSHGVKLSRVALISDNPITPQTTIVEELSEMCASGELDARFIKVESEHSAMAALIGASTAGVRAFTATSGNGLLYMHEVLHWTAGARLPLVMANVNRAVGGVWNIWAEQTDSLSQRDTGWLQIYCESNQEVLDSIIMAYKLAESIALPVMIAYDAFFLSHTTEIVDIPDSEAVDRFLPAFKPTVCVDFENPRMFGGLVAPEFYYEQRYAMQAAAKKALDIYPEICREFESLLGRTYGLLEKYFSDDAEILVVTAGTITSVARLTINSLREEGIAIGLVKLRMFRPLPVQSLQAALGNAERVIVIDRNLSIGSGGIFAHEIQSALYPMDRHPDVYSVIAGLGGRDVTPEDIDGIIRQVMAMDKPFQEPLYWGLKQ